MNGKTEDDKLISPPPRDLILSLHRDALEKANISRLKQKVKSARATYDASLKGFSDGYFFDYEIYDTLKPKEKDELAKIFACLCRKNLALKNLSFVSVAGIVAGLGILNPITLIISFTIILLSVFFVGMAVATSSWWEDLISNFFLDFKNCWKFLSARRFLKKLADKKAVFEE